MVRDGFCARVPMEELGAPGILKKLINKTENEVTVSLCCDSGHSIALELGAGQEQPLKALPRGGGGREDTTWGHGLELFRSRNIPAAHREQSDRLSWLLSWEGENQVQSQT